MNIKKQASFILASAFILSTPIFAAQNTPLTKPSDFMSKSEFASYVQTHIAPTTVTILSNEERLKQLQAYYIDGFTPEEILALKNIGIHLYNYNSSEESYAAYQGSTSDVFVETPAVSYDSNNDEWILVAGGKWTDISWVPFWGGNVGGYECVGYRFNYSNLDSLPNSQRPRPTSVVASLLSITSDAPRDEKEVISYNTNVSSDYGLGSYLQDRALFGGHYVGENFAIVVTYDNRFENVTGDVVGYYIHTDEGIELSSVSLEVVPVGNYSIVLPMPTYNVNDYDFNQDSLPLEL